MKINAHRSYGFTLMEVLIVSALSVIVVGGCIYLMLFVAKADAVLGPQLYRQVRAQQASQNVAEMLRNARKASIKVYKNGAVTTTEAGDRIDFEVPLNAGTLCSVRFINDTTNNKKYVKYYPNTNVTTGSRIIDRDIQSMSFQKLAKDMYAINCQFIYRKFRGYGKTTNDTWNGTFSSQVWPRN